MSRTLYFQIAVTLDEWERVADPFAKATHYLEKALYKMLTQNIMPDVTANLRVRYHLNFTPPPVPVYLSAR